jgi:tetratricopeptide (TPR) repeat protein
MQPNEHRTPRSQAAESSPDSGIAPVREFAEPIPEYLRSGYQALMAGDGATAIKLWESLFERYPSAEVCGHIARAHYYQTFFLGHGLAHPEHQEHIVQMRRWAERALSLNPNSSIGHAMLAAAIGRLAQLTGSQRQIISSSWQVRQHAERAILIDNTWIGHLVLGSWHREIASVHPGLRALAGLLRAKIPEGTYADAIRHFEEVLRQYPENNTIYAEIAYTYEKLGDVKKAREMYDRCLAMPIFRHPIAPHLTAIAAERYQRLIKRANMI